MHLLSELSPTDSAALDARLAGMSDDELRAKMAELRRFMAAVKNGGAKSFLQETFGICGQGRAGGICGQSALPSQGKPRP